MLLAHISLQNVPLRTQCDCIFPLNMVASLTVWVQITFYISYSHWLELLMLVWVSMYVRTYTDPLSRFSVSMLCFLSRFGNWLESVPVSFSSQNGIVKDCFSYHTHSPIATNRQFVQHSRVFITPTHPTVEQNTKHIFSLYTLF